MNEDEIKKYPYSCIALLLNIKNKSQFGTCFIIEKNTAIIDCDIITESLENYKVIFFSSQTIYSINTITKL